MEQTQPIQLSEKQVLPGVGQLIKESLRLYESRFWNLIGILLLPAILSVIFMILFGPTLYLGPESGNVAAYNIGLVAFIVIIFLANVWSSAALTYSVSSENKVSVGSAFRSTFHLIGSYLWLSFLVGFLILGAMILFFIPGVIFATWFCFCTYVFMIEGERGMNAILKSREYVKGHTAAVLGRFIVLGILAVVVALIFSLVFAWVPVGIGKDIVSSVVTILIQPWAFLFGFVLYRALKNLKPGLVFTPTRSQKAKYISIAILGYALIPVVIAIGIFSFLK